MKQKPAIRDRVKELRRVPASELRANPRNWRVHPEPQAAALRGVLAEIGFADAVIARETPEGLELIDGHLRKEIMGKQLVPVLIVDVTEDEANKMLVTLDPLAAMAHADQDALLSLLREATFEDQAVTDLLEALANGEREPMPDLSEPRDDPGADVDRADELLAKWGVERGQVWLIGDAPGLSYRKPHRLMCGDATNEDEVQTLTRGVLAQMIFTDPPWGVDYTGGAKQRDRLKNDHLGTEIYGLVLPILASVTDDNAPLYLWHAGAYSAVAAAAVADAGFEVAAQIIWAKNHAQFVTSAHYKGKHEPCYYGHKKGKSVRWHGGNNEITLWEYERSPRNDYHPTQKPVALALRALNNSTEPAHIVVDFFLGGGTTMVAAEQLGRICYGMEIEPKYVAVTLERMSGMGLEPVLQITGQSVFDKQA